MARIKVQLRRKKRENIQIQEKLVVGSLELNLSSYEVSVRGKKVELAGKELFILKFFMEHPNQVFTKSQIYHHVWDVCYEYDVIPQIHPYLPS